jgi:hypothetical protein
MRSIDPNLLSAIASFSLVILFFGLFGLRPVLYKLDLALTFWFTRRKDMQIAIDEVWPGERISSFWSSFTYHSAEQFEYLISANHEELKEIVQSQKRFNFHCQLFWLAYD